jgi:hypothetical protein
VTTTSCEESSSEIVWTSGRGVDGMESWMLASDSVISISIAD